MFTRLDLVPARRKVSLLTPRPARVGVPAAATVMSTVTARVTATVMAVVLSVVLSGCGLRLETPPPVEPSPGALEVVREHNVQESLALAAAAQSASAAAPSDDVRVLLDEVAAFSRQHADALGGPYDSGLPKPTPTVTPSPAPVVTPAEVVTLLAQADEVARADAVTVDDGPLARLLASIAASRSDLAARLAPLVGVDDPGAAERVAGFDDAPAQAEATLAAPVVRAHDEAGYAFEVMAARRPTATRAAAVTAAARHRELAQRWALAAGVAGKAGDPRLAAYEVPMDLGTAEADAVVAQELAGALAQAHSSAVAGAAVGQREPYVTGLRAATAEGRAWGTLATAFPGMAERAGG